MAVRRLFREAFGSWKADTFSDLAGISAQHGDEAYVIDEGAWYKYDDEESQWRQMASSPPVG